MQNDTQSNINETRKSEDGHYLGQDVADKIGFYGTTPVAQQSSASQAAYTPTAVTAIGTTTISAITGTSGGIHGFASSTAAQALVARVGQNQVDSAAQSALLLEIRSVLVTAGLMKGSA